MVIKFKNNVEDVEKFMQYTYLNLFWLKTYYMTFNIICILSPIIINVYDVKKKSEFYSDASMLILKILMTIIMILFAIYIFFYLLPKVIMKIFKKLSIKHYKNKPIFSAEKTVLVKDDSIEVTYDNKKLIIPLKENIFAHEFKGNIIIASIFLKNKINKVYPVIIPVTAFENEENKDEFIRNINEKGCFIGTKVNS